MACGAASTIQVNGLRLQVYRWGRPELRPALLLHSLAAHSHWWDGVAPLLAEHFQVVALDLRGHGGSDWVEPAAYRTVDYAGDIVAVLDALGWRSPLVIGHSLGGYIGVNLASLHPDRVGALVIVESGRGGGPPQAEPTGDDGPG
jgi:pimeloyl-ACP methyl ester carboxylesterase